MSSTSHVGTADSVSEQYHDSRLKVAQKSFGKENPPLLFANSFLAAAASLASRCLRSLASTARF